MFIHPTEIEERTRDQEIFAAATPGPWTVAHADDDVCMSTILVSRDGGLGELDDHENNVALVLLQSPRYADVGDGKWHENAEMIARARTRWPAALERVLELEQKVAELERQVADLKRQA
jgi:hypothetical protein